MQCTDQLWPPHPQHLLLNREQVKIFGNEGFELAGYDTATRNYQVGASGPWGMGGLGGLGDGSAKSLPVRL